MNTEFKITEDQRTKILGYTEEIDSKNNTIAALTSSIDTIIERYSPINKVSIEVDPIQGIPYLTSLLQEAIAHSKKNTYKIFNIMYGKEKQIKQNPQVTTAWGFTILKVKSY